jgi:hypothetical protein
MYIGIVEYRSILDIVSLLIYFKIATLILL